MSTALPASERVLVLMTNAADMDRTVQVLATAGLEGVACTDGPHLCRELAAGAGAVLLSEEVILSDRERCIQQALLHQPAWSSIPLVAVVQAGAAFHRRDSLLSDFSANVTLIERPVRMRTLVSVVRGALRARQHQYEVREAIAERELALDAARLGWWRYDPVTRRTSYDARYREIFGISGNERPAEELLRLVHPDDVSGVSAAVEAALDLRDPKPFSAEYRVHRPDGQVCWVEAHGLASFEGEGEMRRAMSFVGTAADITQRKTTEEQLRRSSDTFYNLIQNNPFGIYVVDADFRLLQVSKGAQKVFSNVRPLLGRDFAEILRTIWVEPFASEAAARFRHTLETGEPYGAPTTERRNDVAAVESYDWQIERVVLPDGRFGVVCYFYDLTDLRRVESALRASEERFRRAFEIETVGVIFFDRDGVITQANDAFLRMGGYDRDEIAAGRLSWNELTPPEWIPASLRAIAELKTLGRTAPYEKEYFRKDGSRFSALFAARQITEEEGVEFVLDITDRKRAEDALRDADRRKDQFLATLAHELRNPLAPISNALQAWPLIADDRAKTEQMRGLIDRQVQQMIRLIDDLLDVSRVSRGKLKLRKQRLDLAVVVESALEGVRPFVEACHHALSVSLPDQPIALEGDPGRLMQVIGNLVHNAAKYSGRNGHISLKAWRDGGEAVVSIQDDGAGIPREMLGRIFEIFTQVDDTLDRAHGGLGIGLTLVKTLVELHGGTVEAKSDGPGQGSEFIVRLPAGLHSTDEPPTDIQPTSVFLRTAPPKSRRVLVVDDVRPSANTLALMLEGLGQETRTAYDGASALTVADEFRPDVIFLDIAMPGMDGYEVAKRIRATDLRPVLVALTGYGQEEDRRQAFDAGFDHHLVKPTSVDALHRLLEDAAGVTALAEE